MTLIASHIALVTGANRGLGREFVAQLLERGVQKVYSTARDITKIDTSDPRVVPLQLDVTDAESVRRAAEVATDVTFLINNAGIATRARPLDADQTDMRREFETNVFGQLRVISAFAPSIVSNGNGVILDVLSAGSWITLGDTYEVTKSAFWSVTSGIRLELAPQGVQVVGLHLGFIDTEMTAYSEAPKMPPAEAARLALDGVEAGEIEVLDETSKLVRAGLSDPLEDQFARFVPTSLRPKDRD